MKKLIHFVIGGLTVVTIYVLIAIFGWYSAELLLAFVTLDTPDLSFPWLLIRIVIAIALIVYTIVMIKDKAYRNKMLEDTEELLKEFRK